MVEEEIGCGIFHFCIITEAITPTITGKRAYRFKAGTPLVFQLNKSIVRSKRIVKRATILSPTDNTVPSVTGCKELLPPADIRST